jgi:glycosyltransferase involved in cell wall biosynthesis
MTRVRNESLLLKDSLDHMATFVDGIVVYDDDSDDDTATIAANHPAVLEVVRNRRWRAKRRVWEETANRRKLYQRALKYRSEWVFYADADERFEGDIRGFLLDEAGPEIGAVRVELFDAYLTSDDREPFRPGDSLWNFRRYFGPERRTILMAWRPTDRVDFVTPDAREPQGVTGEMITRFACQHYGKALSEEHWEETCRYYIDNFPIYREKWRSRLGKAIHTRSDFDTALYTWADVRANAVDI